MSIDFDPLLTMLGLNAGTAYGIGETIKEMIDQKNAFKTKDKGAIKKAMQLAAMSPEQRLRSASTRLLKRGGIGAGIGLAGDLAMNLGRHLESKKQEDASQVAKLMARMR